MLWFIIIGLLVVGLILLIVEVVFIPGTTVVGILGVIFSIIGVVLSYTNFGNATGTYVLLSTLICTGVGLYFSFKSEAWATFALKSSMKSKVNEDLNLKLKVGDEGISVSALRPSGKAEFGQQIIEVKSTGMYIEPKKRIKIILIDPSQIIVELI